MPIAAIGSLPCSASSSLMGPQTACQFFLRRHLYLEGRELFGDLFAVQAILIRETEALDPIEQQPVQPHLRVLI